MIEVALPNPLQLSQYCESKEIDCIKLILLYNTGIYLIHDGYTRLVKLSPNMDQIPQLLTIMQTTLNKKQLTFINGQYHTVVLCIVPLLLVYNITVTLVINIT